MNFCIFFSTLVYHASSVHLVESFFPSIRDPRHVFVNREQRFLALELLLRCCSLRVVAFAVFLAFDGFSRAPLQGILLLVTMADHFRLRRGVVFHFCERNAMKKDEDHQQRRSPPKRKFSILRHYGFRGIICKPRLCWSRRCRHLGCLIRSKL
jgi:hypothetical protein